MFCTVLTLYATQNYPVIRWDNKFNKQTSEKSKSGAGQAMMLFLFIMNKLCEYGLGKKVKLTR